MKAWPMLLALVLCGTIVHGQTQTDGCGFTAGAEWPVGAACNPLDFDKPASYGNDMNPAGCGGSANDDAFAWFAGTGNPVTVTYAPPATADADLHVLTGTCAAPTVVACSDNCCGGAVESVAIPTTLGTNYIVRVQRWGGNGGMNNGTLCVYDAPPPPANDDPCGATVLPVNSSCTYTTSTTTYATGTTGVPDPTCSYYNGADVWFTATVPASGAITVTTAAGVVTDGGMALYTATACSGTFTEVACNDDAIGFMPQITASGLTPGSTVYVRFWEYGGDNNGTFSICAQSVEPPPTPVCGGMFYDPGGATGNYANNTNYTVTICPDNPGDIVILDFTSFDTEDFIDELQIFDGPTTASPLIGTYSGATLPPVAMSSDPSGCLTVAFNSDGIFNYTGWVASVICQSMPAGDCVYLLQLGDSNGNGWGSSSVGVRINGGAWTYYTVTGASNLVLIGVNLGDLLEINYNASGPNQGQNSWSISKLGQNPYFSSGTPPSSGIAFTQTVDCGPPPAQPQDCVGGVTICSSQNITNNSSSTGDVMDLDATNEGCLAAGERQGTWYYFSPQTAGTIAFSIAPASGTDDYDFAVWGPFTQAQCPSSLPLRCSFDAPGPYTTGLNGTATATTEGAAGTGWVQDIDANAGEVYVLYVDNYSTSGQAFTLSWQLSNGSSLDCTTLPVELLDLEATAQDPVIKVTWATATEQNSHHFNVQRSADNEHFTTIGTVAAAGNAQFRNDYLFVDQNPIRGVNYYRLEQVDIDGASMLTRTVVATLTNGDGRPVLFPNPATGSLGVVFNSPVDGTAMLAVLDAVGRTVAVHSVTVRHGQHSVQLPLHRLAAGWYSLRITLPGGSALPAMGFLKE